MTGGAHPAFAAFAALGLPEAGRATLAELNAAARRVGLAATDGRPLSFVAANGRLSALDYERKIAAEAAIPTREANAHDDWNARVWLAFPQTKAALNAIHATAAPVPTPNARDRRRDAATLLDEHGMIAGCTDAALLADWRAHRWRELFWDARERVRAALVPATIGHGLLVKLSTPFRALAAKVLVVAVEPRSLPVAPLERCRVLDTAAAQRLRGGGDWAEPGGLLPLPVAALPGWDTERLGAALFDDGAVFRRSRVAVAR